MGKKSPCLGDPLCSKWGGESDSDMEDSKEPKCSLVVYYQVYVVSCTRIYFVQYCKEVKGYLLTRQKRLVN